MSRSEVIVVDTNVWLDYLLGFRSNHVDAQAFIVEARRLDLPLVIPSHCLKDVFILLQQQLKAINRVDGKQSPEAAAASARMAAWAAVDFIMDMSAVGPTDQSDAWLAAKHRAIHSDYEDNLVVACAMRLDARMLVTGDTALVRHSPVATLTPKDALSLIALD